MQELMDIPVEFEGYYVAAFTDEYRVGFWPIRGNFDIENKLGKLLELRVFNENEEHKLFRGCTGEEFNYRRLSDANLAIDGYEEPIVEYQILDINFKNGVWRIPGEVNMAKGGKFYLPLEEGSINVEDKPVIIVKYYIPKYREDDDTTIHAYVKDWRFAGFKREEYTNGEN